MNESQLLEASNPYKGLTGVLNWISQKCRERKFERKINGQVEGEKYYKIYAEGDSWFQYPTTLKDIIDWLNERKNFIIYSDAYAGDWVTNMIYEGQYVTGLSLFSPDIFLISGGGNDILGGNRLAFLVDGNGSSGANEKSRSEKKRRYDGIDDIKSDFLTPKQKESIIHAQDFLTKEFYAMLLVFKIQYSKMFSRLYCGKDSTKKDIISITQGYDYAIPDFGNSPFNHPCHGQWIYNIFHREWLFTPLMMKGITNKDDQKSIILAMIYEFNEIMGSFALSYKNVFHVDNRGLTGSRKDWHNEIHLTGDNYKKVANTYEHIIRNYEKLQADNQKIIRTT